MKHINQRYDGAIFSYIHLFAIYIYSSVIFFDVTSILVGTAP